MCCVGCVLGRMMVSLSGTLCICIRLPKAGWGGVLVLYVMLHSSLSSNTVGTCGPQNPVPMTPPLEMLVFTCNDILPWVFVFKDMKTVQEGACWNVWDYTFRSTILKSSHSGSFRRVIGMVIPLVNWAGYKTASESQPWMEHFQMGSVRKEDLSLPHGLEFCAEL